ncbi:hypothetical protein P170DRAFT_244516 [Aspergillus steynii IBT 23096]|uniref:Secreted protein n=1 Tax=Aspergillus steynii IBT 23096 TaxID=1392250 RepID=A0A2I2FXW7_9EURO|nr:uncharacterized protein P170DRAFT_244516 [Aspergillus steynii IBT 23096]PLB45474.1 hypothetical protein P170DRAFT_244516 [Aspergillus steynii IBT 23096]
MVLRPCPTLTIALLSIYGWPLCLGEFCLQFVTCCHTVRSGLDVASGYNSYMYPRLMSVSRFFFVCLLAIDSCRSTLFVVYSHVEHSVYGVAI